jgi:hypothetical protein
VFEVETRSFDLQSVLLSDGQEREVVCIRAGEESGSPREELSPPLPQSVPLHSDGESVSSIFVSLVWTGTSDKGAALGCAVVSAKWRSTLHRMPPRPEPGAVLISGRGGEEITDDTMRCSKRGWGRRGAVAVVVELGDHGENAGDAKCTRLPRKRWVRDGTRDRGDGVQGALKVLRLLGRGERGHSVADSEECAGVWRGVESCAGGGAGEVERAMSIK